MVNVIPLPMASSAAQPLVGGHLEQALRQFHESAAAAPAANA